MSMERLLFYFFFNHNRKNGINATTKEYFILSTNNLITIIEFEYILLPCKIYVYHTKSILNNLLL